MDFALKRNQQVHRKTRSADLPGYHKYHSPCVTPSTDDNRSLIIYTSPRSITRQYNIMSSNRTDLQQLFYLIYFEDYKYADIKDFFKQKQNSSVLKDFQQILYDAQKEYLRSIKQAIYSSLNDVYDYRMIQKVVDSQASKNNLYQSFGKHATKYCKTIQLIMSYYDTILKKAKEIQKVVDQFLRYMASLNKFNNGKQRTKINCSELHKTSFTEEILKDENIKPFLNNLTYIFTYCKFYQQSFRIAYQNLEQINKLRTQQPKPAIVQICYTNSVETKAPKPVKSIQVSVTDSKSTQILNHQLSGCKIQQLDTTSQTNDISDLFVSPKEANKVSQNFNNTDQKSKKQLKKKKKAKEMKEDPSYIKDDIKEFERRIDLEFELSKKTEKIEIAFPQDWINKYKNKWMQALKMLH